jgi:hypothetical protein
MALDFVIFSIETEKYQMSRTRRWHEDEALNGKTQLSIIIAVWIDRVWRG